LTIYLYSINDLINEDGTYLTLDQFQEKYKIVVNFLKYNSIISAIRQAKRSFNTGESRLVCPFIPSIVQQLLRHKKGSKDRNRNRNKFINQIRAPGGNIQITIMIIIPH
jgi:hypothetical protein